MLIVILVFCSWKVLLEIVILSENLLHFLPATIGFAIEFQSDRPL